jgi:hypothetical protein
VARFDAERVLREDKSNEHAEAAVRSEAAEGVSPMARCKEHKHICRPTVDLASNDIVHTGAAGYAHPHRVLVQPSATAPAIGWMARPPISHSGM